MQALCLHACHACRVYLCTQVHLYVRVRVSVLCLYTRMYLCRLYLRRGYTDVVCIHNLPIATYLCHPYIKVYIALST